MEITSIVENTGFQKKLHVQMTKHTKFEHCTLVQLVGNCGIPPNHDINAGGDNYLVLPRGAYDPELLPLLSCVIL